MTHLSLDHCGCVIFWVFSDLVSPWPLEVDNVAVLSILILWLCPRAITWPASGHVPCDGDTCPEAGTHVCQLVSSWATNCFNLSRYWLYNSTSLWPAPWKKDYVKNVCKQVSSVCRILLAILSHLHPQRLHCSRAPLVDGEAVREIYDLVLRPVNHQHRRHHPGDLVDTENIQQSIDGKCSNESFERLR